jgi:hypothetical protein
MVLTLAEVKAGYTLTLAHVLLLGNVFVFADNGLLVLNRSNDPKGEAYARWSLHYEGLFTESLLMC